MGSLKKCKTVTAPNGIKVTSYYDPQESGDKVTYIPIGTIMDSILRNEVVVREVFNICSPLCGIITEKKSIRSAFYECIKSTYFLPLLRTIYENQSKWESKIEPFLGNRTKSVAKLISSNARKFYDALFTAYYDKLEAIYKSNKGSLSDIERYQLLNARPYLNTCTDVVSKLLFPEETTIKKKETTEMEPLNPTDQTPVKITPVTPTVIKDIGELATAIAQTFGVTRAGALRAATVLKAEEINRDFTPLLASIDSY